MIPTWPLVGRDRALERVHDLLARPDLSGIVLVGPAGVGKTRLAKECLTMGEDAGMVTALAVASRAAADIPLGALAHLIPPAASAVERGVAMLQLAQEGLAELAGDRRLLLVVDDAHNLDDASALVLQQLAVNTNSFVVATVRGGEVVPDPVAALWKDGMAERVELEPLTPTAVAELLEQVLEGPVEASALQQLWNASEGNVLYLRELVLAGLDANTLVDDAGLWRVVGTVSGSSRLTDLVESRLEGLGRDELAALELVAFGEPIGVDVIERLSGNDAIEALERKGLLSTETEDRRVQARLAHPLHGDVLRERTPVLRARAVRRALADAVEQAGTRRRSDVLRVALWRLDGGGDAPAELLMAAAHQAKSAFDNHVAYRLARAAYESEPNFNAGYMIADCLYDLGRTAETEEVLASLEQFALSDNDRGLVIVLRSFNLFWHLGRGDEARAVADQGIALLESEEAREEVEGRLAVLEATAGRPLEAMQRVEEILEVPEGRAFCQAALGAALALPLLGRADEGLRLADEGRIAHERLGYQLAMFEPALLDVARVLALSELGRLDEAIDAAHQAFNWAVSANDNGRWAFPALALGVLHLEAGRAAESVRWWREAASLFRLVNNLGVVRWALTGLLFAQSLLRDTEGARATLAELDVIGPHPAEMQEANLHRARAWLAAVEQDRAAARVHLEEAADLAASRGIRSQELMALHDLARLGFATEVLERAQAVADGMIGDVAPARVRHIAALTTGDADELAAAAEALRATGRTLAAAEAATAAAEAHRRLGDAKAAAAWERQGADLAHICEGVVTPALVTAAGPTPLTQREREIAVLARDGLASRDIAERLCVSVRTVDNHLSRVYDKLGISSRSDLADLILTD